MAVFGLLPARELAELAIDTLGFQHYWKTAVSTLLRVGGSSAPASC
jgi:hypothetical protein